MSNTAHHHAEEAPMSNTTTTIKPGTVRWLAANGHPGYSKATAVRVAALMERYPSLSFHEAVYGGARLQVALMQITEGAR